ncbi:MAG: cupin domain-containing protein [Gammaproteobacteria bacterium]
MGKVRIIATDEIDWQPVHEAVAPEVAARMSPAERDAGVRILHAGADGEPQLFEASIAPDAEVSLHAHEADEIIYILAGEMQIGRKRLGPGASAFIAGQTLYGFRAGPEGVRFLNFRADANTSFITREEYLAARGKGR